MLYAIAITVAAGLALILLLTGLGVLVFRGGWRGLSIRGWRWRPNAIGFTILALVVTAVMWRFFPGFLFLPFIIPFFFWRMGGRRRGPYTWTWRSGQRREPSSNGHTKDDGAIEGQYRNTEDE